MVMIGRKLFNAHWIARFSIQLLVFLQLQLLLCRGALFSRITLSSISSHSTQEGMESSPQIEMFSPLPSPISPIYRFKKPSNTLSGRELQYHGTTTLAFRNNDSVIVCVDSKASMGSFVGSRTVKKIFPVTPRIVATMAGGAADCAAWIRDVSTSIQLLQKQYETPLGVSAVAHLLAAKLRQHRDKDLSVGTMIGGVDDSGPRLFYVDNDGTCLEGDFFCVGSGAQIAYSVLDSFSSLSLNEMSREKALNLALWAVKHATHRDGFSGGYINVFQINNTGIFHLKRVDCRELQI